MQNQYIDRAPLEQAVKDIENEIIFVESETRRLKEREVALNNAIDAAPSQNKSLKLAIAQARVDGTKPPKGEIVDIELLQMELSATVTKRREVDGVGGNQRNANLLAAKGNLVAWQNEISRAHFFHLIERNKINWGSANSDDLAQMTLAELSSLYAAYRALGQRVSIGGFLDHMIPAGVADMDNRIQDAVEAAIAFNATYAPKGSKS